MHCIDNRIQLAPGERLVADPGTAAARELFPAHPPPSLARRIDATHVAIDIAALGNGIYAATDAVGTGARIEVRRGRIFRFDPTAAADGACGPSHRAADSALAPARAA